MRRFLRSDGNPTTKGFPVDFQVHNRLRALPDSSNPNNYIASAPENITLTAVNYFNDLAADTDLFDRSKRQEIMCAAKLKTLDLIYYIQHDLNEPLWSVANDEGYDSPYNREENLCPEHSPGIQGTRSEFPVAAIHSREPARHRSLHVERRRCSPGSAMAESDELY